MSIQQTARLPSENLKQNSTLFTRVFRSFDKWLMTVDYREELTPLLPKSTGSLCNSKKGAYDQHHQPSE